MREAAEDVGGADQDYRADRRHREKADAAVNHDSQLIEDPLADDRADEAEDDIGEEAEALPAHQLPSEPSGDESDDDCSEEVMHAHEFIRLPRGGVSEAGGVREWFPVIPDGRRRWLLLLIHRRAAALQLAAAALGDDYLRAALSTDVDFSELVSHFPETLLESMLCPKLTRP
jgi:hypothetical protein